MGGIGMSGIGGLAGSLGAEEQPTEEKGCGEGQSGNPVILYSGNKVEAELDFASQGEMGLYLRRSYNHKWNARGLFGRHWMSNFDYSLTASASDGKSLLWLQYPDGRRIKLVHNAAQGRWNEDRADPIVFAVQHPDGSYTVYNEYNGVERYTQDGYIVELRNEQGISWSFSYSNKYLQQVAHSSGRSVRFSWDANGQLVGVTDPAGHVYQYSYTPNVFGAGLARLAGVRMPGEPATSVTYHYEDSRYPGGLTGKSFNGVRYSTFSYDDQGRAVSTEHAGGVERHTFSYVIENASVMSPPPAPPPPGGYRSDGDNERGWCEYRQGTASCYRPRSTIMPMMQAAAAPAQSGTAISGDYVVPTRLTVTETNPLGKRTSYLFVDGRLTDVNGHASSRCSASFKTRTHDENGFDDLVSDFENNLTDYDYDAAGRLLRRVEAAGTSAERTTTYGWDTAKNRVLRVTVNGMLETHYVYTTDGRIASVTQKNVSDGGQPGQVRTTTYAYTKHGNGILASMTVDGPIPGSGDALVHAYSSTGDLLSVTNGLGHVVTYGNYNGLGQPERIVGINQNVTEYRFDGRGRLVEERKNNSALNATRISYDEAGNPASISTPDGVVRSYVYDAARRLKQEFRPMPDGSYAVKQYQYDLASNVTRVEEGSSSYLPTTRVIGTIDRISVDAAWNHAIEGWACSTGMAEPVQVDLYAGGAAGTGAHLGAVTANLPGDAALGASCQSQGTAYRFKMPISPSMRQTHGGKSVYAHGLSLIGGRAPLDNSGTLTIPTAPVVGQIEGISYDGAGNYYLNGWACSVGVVQPIDVQLYVGGPADTGSNVVTVKAGNSSSNAAHVVNACQTNQTARSFKIWLDPGFRTYQAGKPLYLYGLSPVGTQHDGLMAGSGSYTVPGVVYSAEFVGWSAPSRMASDETATFTLQMRNTGNVIWGGAGAPGIWLQYGNSTGAMSTVAGLNGTVAPGQTATFSWSYTAPRPAGSYAARNFFGQMTASGKGFFGPVSPAHALEITNPYWCPGKICSSPL
jgi:YD repeat-containing protein